MATYRESRNIEASVIDWLDEILKEHNWTDIRIEKVFANVYKSELPAILVNIVSVDSQRKEIGNKSWLNYYTFYFRIFANNDGQREDLMNFLVWKLEEDVDYYQYTINNGQVSNKELKGRICMLNITRNEREYLATEAIEKEDRYRQLISVKCYVAKEN